MTHSQASLEEIGTSTKAPTFLGEVERLASAIDDYIIPSLRMEPHSDSWSPNNLKEEIPDFALQGGISKETVVEVVSRYLNETVSVVEAVTGVRNDRFSYIVDPVEKNVSVFPHTADCWRERHYSKKFSLDRKVETIHQELDAVAQQKVAELNASLGLNGFPKLSLNGTLAHSLAEYRQGLYRRTGVQGEEPVLLYQLCFQALAEAKGWDKLKYKELLKVLDAEGIPVKEFTELTDREIKFPAEPVIEVGENRMQIQSPSAAIGRCELVSTNSWFSALEELRRQGSSKTAELNGRTHIRQFTLKENLQARIEDYNTLVNSDGTARTEGERKRFFVTWLDSCSGIHYLAQTNRFKIIPQSPQLITLAQVPAADYLSIPYAQSAGRELDSTAPRAKYNCDLSRAEVLEHPAWLAAVEEDRTLLGEAFDVVRTVKNATADWKGMGFYVYPNKPQDELRPLFVGGLGRDGNADVRILLSDGGRFLRR